MARAAKRALKRSTRPEVSMAGRFTVDASVFVNAFNPHEEGHAGSLRFLARIREHGDPIIVPTLLLPEVSSAMARASDDAAGAVRYAKATARLPHLTLVTLTPAVARDAAELAAAHRLRGADSVYVSVARRYGATLISRDQEQRTRGSAAVSCLSPEEAVVSEPRRRLGRAARPSRPTL